MEGITFEKTVRLINRVVHNHFIDSLVPIHRLVPFRRLLS